MMDLKVYKFQIPIYVEIERYTVLQSKEEVYEEIIKDLEERLQGLNFLIIREVDNDGGDDKNRIDVG